MGDNVTIVESGETQNCYVIIADFFSSWSMASATKNLNKILRSAMDTNPTKLNPSNVLYFYKKLSTLISAALQINRCGCKRIAAIISQNENAIPDLTNYKGYFGWHRHPSIWCFAPRALNQKEYFNPYKVFKKLAAFADQKQWKFLLNELQDFTFYNTSFAECEGYNIMVISTLLQKLIEAAHLIDVRAISEVNGTARPKWNGRKE